ncbi:ferrous iron transport protein B [Flavobacteriaceae bacterium Ap0902]|nr:ferrous iron transport protein B [Flavobacteriaceae bacterium Ap0902]
MPIKVALIGNPNVGKSTLFNRLTGLKQRIGNYPGTTVDKRIGKLTIHGQDVLLYDFPGTYSLYPKSADEEVVFDILSNPNHPDFPDKVFVIGHPLRLKRSLLLFRQVQDLGIPVKFVMNMMDQAEKSGKVLNKTVLESYTASGIIYSNARTGEGVNELKESILNDFPIKESAFHVPVIYANAIHDIKVTFGIDHDYLAYQYAAQPKVGHLSKDQEANLKIIEDQYSLVPARLQVAETIQRYQEIEKIVSNVMSAHTQEDDSITDKLDRVLTHPFWGYLIFFGLLFLAFQAIYTWAEVPMDFIDSTFAYLQNQARDLLGDGPLPSLITDGIIPGIGGVVIFVPQITILIFFLLLFEETGYMSRVVFLMDKWMRPFGLNGKSVVPLMSGAACAIPGIMAARNIENVKERLITVLVTPLMTCSARLPVYAILIALVIPSKKIYGIDLQGLVLMGLYILGLVAALVFAFVFKKFLKSHYKSYLIMEMPDYHMPHWRNLFLGLWEKVSAFIFGAGRIILAVSVILWVLSSWGPTDNFRNAEEIVAVQTMENNWTAQEAAHHLESQKLEYSALGHIGKAIEPVFRPLGYDWKISIGVLSSFAAREVFVGTMATIYSIGSDTEEETQIVQRMRNEELSDGTKVFNLATGASLLLFYAFAMQCVSTLAIVKKETGTWKWPLVQLVFMSATAYIAAFIVYQLLK